jgi:prevent-host-death family protein
MKIVPVAEVKAHLSSYLEAAASGAVIITKNGRAVAALVAVTDDEELERLVLAHSPRLRRLLDEAAARVKREGGIPHDQFWAQVDAEAAERERAEESKDP